MSSPFRGLIITSATMTSSAPSLRRGRPQDVPARSSAASAQADLLRSGSPGSRATCPSTPATTMAKRPQQRHRLPRPGHVGANNSTCQTRRFGASSQGAGRRESITSTRTVPDHRNPVPPEDAPVLVPWTTALRWNPHHVPIVPVVLINGALESEPASRSCRSLPQVVTTYRRAASGQALEHDAGCAASRAAALRTRRGDGAVTDGGRNGCARVSSSDHRAARRHVDV
jgi:hypothetical protein